MTYPRALAIAAVWAAVAAISVYAGGPVVVVLPLLWVLGFLATGAVAYGRKP
ncbi:hypothetical protein [Shumkonia mesophila]|uniref:hypothetical protein n=1 Tax=Shumkonia mesophila TaxID=2838854 RepID=UPI0029346101|nr:hypothetical protein [Shumkonia mesophila]